MKWRDHKRLAAQMARIFDLEYFKAELIEGSIEPDKKKEVVHTWPKARRTTRAKMYRARRAFLKGKMKRCARYLGIVSHYIEDGIVHGVMDAFSRDGDHSLVEGDIGSRADISSMVATDLWQEGFIDGEFVFREIDSLVQGGASPESLGRALSLLGSAVLSPPDAPPQLVESERRFTERLRQPPVKILAGAGVVLAALGTLVAEDLLWLLLLPAGLLYPGKPALFRVLKKTGPLLVGIALLGFIYRIDQRFDWPRLLLTILLAAQTSYLAAVPDLGKWGARWYRLPEDKG